MFSRAAGPGVSGGIPSLKSNLTVNSLHAGTITGASNPGLDHLLLVFVHKARAKKVTPDLEGFNLKRPQPGLP